MRLPALRAEPIPLRAASPTKAALTPDRLIAGGVAGLGAASAVMLARAAGDWRFAVGFLVGFAAIAAAIVLAARMRVGVVAGEAAPRPDRALLRAALDICEEPAAITDRAGRLIAANVSYIDRFGA
ncbi:MAG TPA: hybrid sensor histidine kinase/response regulator, partial [Sphingomonas sp.]